MLVWKKKLSLIRTKRLLVLTNEEFYNEVARVLGTTYDCLPFPWTSYWRTRWNNRAPGSGRYPGFGLVRCFGDTVHIALQDPITVNKVFATKDDALRFLVDIFSYLD
jgi:hypothetical protein